MFNLSDRVRETSLTEGSGSVTIHDTYGGFQSFASGVGDGNQTFYAIENNVRFEIGLGTFNDGVLSRDLIFTSTDPSGNKINLDGVSTVFCTYPATHSVFINPDGNVSGLLPRYSGIACPDGLVQTRAFIGSGNTGNVAYWSDENTIGGDDTFIWDSSDNTLHIDGNLAVSGSIKDAQFYSSSAGSLFHAYIDNSNNDIVALHITDESDPTWKLGLKPYSTAFADAPTNGYVYGDIDSIGNVVDTSNYYLMNYTNGFFVRHRGTTLLSIDRNNGININNNSSVEVPLTVNASAGQASNLQEWKSYTGSLISSLSKDGQMELSSVKFPDGTVQTSVGVGIVTSGIIGSGTTNFIPKFSDTDTLTNSIINTSGNTIGVNTPANGVNFTIHAKNIHPVYGAAIINENAFGNSTGSIIFENRESGVRLGTMYSYGTAYAGGSIASVGSGGTAFSNITGPVAVGPLDANKPLIFGGGTNRYATIYASEFRINPSNLNQDFIIQGASTDDLLYVDASTDRVGLGTNTPLTKFHIHAKTSEGTVLSQTDLYNSFAGFLVRNQDNVNVFSAQYCNSGVAQTGLRNTVIIGSRESGVPVKFYQGKETTNIIGAAGAFEPNNERIIFDVDGNTILTSASGQNVQVSGVNLRIPESYTPASASSSGNKGEVVWDSDYVYVCVATNTWKRSTLTTW